MFIGLDTMWKRQWWTDFDAVDGEHDRMLRYTRLEMEFSAHSAKICQKAHQCACQHVDLDSVDLVNTL